MIIWRIFAANKQRNTNLKTYMDMKKFKDSLDDGYRGFDEPQFHILR